MLTDRSNITRLSTSANGLGLPLAERPYATASRAMGGPRSRRRESSSRLPRYTVRRLRRWLFLKHKKEAVKYVRFPDTRLRDDYGLALLSRRAMGLPSAKA